MPTSSCIPGFDFGAFGKNSVDYGGSSNCDSWSSSTGNYSTAPNPIGPCNIGTDGTGAGAMTLHGTASEIAGNVEYGVGGTDATSLTVNGHPGYGASGPLASTVVMPDVVIPTLGSNLGACASCAITAGNTYTTVSGSVTFPAGSYVIGSLTANITVTSGPVIIYVNTVGATTGNFAPGTITNKTGSAVAPVWGIPADLMFMVGPTVTSIDLTGVTGYFALYAPDADISMHGNGNIYGAVIGKSFTISGTPAIHYDTQLATATLGTFNCVVTPVEISRSSPVVALGDTVHGLTNTTGSNAYVVQGSFEAPSGTATTIGTSPSITASVAAFTFPYTKGHVRARLASSLATAGTGVANATSFSSGTILFDAGATGMIPTVTAGGCATFAGTCRNVFTITSSPGTSGVQFHPTTVQLNTTNAAAIGALIVPATGSFSTITTANYQTIITTILNGKLGGVDRSTVAAIQASGTAGSSTRATMAYFGAADGMLHAVCASNSGGCAGRALGTELWAFIPRVQLPAIAKNTAKIDGSVHVADVFGDFTSTTATGTRSWHTILTFQTGYSTNATSAAAYAIDVTNPSSPTVLWEYATPATPAASDLGTGLTVAMGPTLINDVTTNLAVLETFNGGTGGAGVFVQALQQENGATVWANPFSYLYSATTFAANHTRYTALTAGQQGQLATGIPGGAVGVDLAGQGFNTDFVLGDIFGDVWRLSATDGTSRNGTGIPAFAFTTNFHPIGASPAIYSNGSKEFAAFVSGGYDDPTAAAWTTATQYIIALNLGLTGTPITEATGVCSVKTAANCTLAVDQTITGFGFAQALVVGTQLLVTTDSGDINSASYATTAGASTGTLSTVDLAGAAATSTVAIVSGAGSIVNNGSTLYSSGGNQQMQVTATATTTGPTVDLSSTSKVLRSLWLRTQ